MLSALDLMRLSDEQLAEQEYYCAEAYGEFKAQYASECALYGDAGPGQGIHVAELRAELHRIQAEFKRRYPIEQLIPGINAGKQPFPPDNDDIDF